MKIRTSHINQKGLSYRCTVHPDNSSNLYETHGKTATQKKKIPNGS